MVKLYYKFVDGDTLTFDVSHLENDEIIKEYIKPLNKGEWISLTRDNNGIKEFHSINPANVIRIKVNSN